MGIVIRHLLSPPSPRYRQPRCTCHLCGEIDDPSKLTRFGCNGLHLIRCWVLCGEINYGTVSLSAGLSRQAYGTVRCLFVPKQCQVPKQAKGGQKKKLLLALDVDTGAG